MPKLSESKWCVYLVRCSDQTLYCGVTRNLPRRVQEHNGSRKAARYTRTRRPVSLVWFEKKRSRSAALKRELRIKRLRREEKEKLIELELRNIQSL